ncbi:hypothetical protein Tco_0008538 [Tanacetum coccineum]
MHDSAILEDSLPPKEKDQGIFTIPCYINNNCFEKALADLGASVSVMPYSTFTNLGLGELAPTKLIIELVDRTRKRLKGIAENVLVGIDKFVFLIDNIVLDMPEDIKVPLILERLFLSTAHAKIDVFKRKITLRVEDDKLYAYRDEGMGDVIVGKPFCREIYVKVRRFDGMITIYNGNDGVTYQMVRSHPRFKHLTNAKCDKMRPLLKVSAHDKLNGISHPYQKLNFLYKGVLNLGPEYIRDAKIEEFLTRGHVSIHEMK